MSLLDGFETLSLAKGLPMLTFTKHGAAFSKTAVLCLKKSPYVKLMLNKEQLLLAVKPCKNNEEDAVPFCRSYAQNPSARINNAFFIATIEKMTGCNTKEGIHKVQGEYHEEEDVMIFNLRELCK